MMTPQSWLMYLSLVVVATASPGPAVLFITTTATLHGWKKAVFAAVGNICGLFCLGIVAVTGLGTILNASELIFNLVKYAGAAYLVYLGIKLFYQKHPGFDDLKRELAPAEVSPAKIGLQAFGVAVSNPKAIVFLTALFPQFLSIHGPLAPQFCVLISVLMVFSFSFLMLYALTAHKVRAWFASPRRTRVFGRAGGAIFIGFGVLLALSSKE